MANPLSITTKKEKDPSCCSCFGRPNKKHVETKKKIAELTASELAKSHSERKPDFDSSVIRKDLMTDDQIASLFSSQHKRVPTQYPRDEKK